MTRKDSTKKLIFGFGHITWINGAVAHCHKANPTISFENTLLRFVNNYGFGRKPTKRLMISQSHHRGTLLYKRTLNRTIMHTYNA